MDYHRGIKLATEEEENPVEPIEPEIPEEPDTPVEPEPDNPEEPEPEEPEPDEPGEEPPQEPEEPVEEPDSAEIKELKFRLREAEYPLFSKEELQFLLDSNKNDVDMATYRGAMLKAEANGLTLNGMEFKTMAEYFLRIAAMYRPTHSGILRTD